MVRFGLDIAFLPAHQIIFMHALLRHRCILLRFGMRMGPNGMFPDHLHPPVVAQRICAVLIVMALLVKRLELRQYKMPLLQTKLRHIQRGTEQPGRQQQNQQHYLFHAVIISDECVLKMECRSMTNVVPSP